MKIGEVARAAGVAIDTIRYYERLGLLPAPLRRPSGYRVYEADAVARVRFVKRAQDLGFTLDEIQELLRLRDQRGSCMDVQALARRKLEELDTRVGRLLESRAALAEMAAGCPGRGPITACAILDAIARTPRDPRSGEPPEGT